VSNLSVQRTEALRELEKWLEWLDSDSGIEHRKKWYGKGTDCDLAYMVPITPRMAIITVGHIRELVALARRGLESEQE
jgi:hypothetical protein